MLRELLACFGRFTVTYYEGQTGQFAVCSGRCVAKVILATIARKECLLFSITETDAVIHEHKRREKRLRNYNKSIISKC